MKLYPLKYLIQHEKQYEATSSDKAIRALFWGNRVGKTEWGAQETTKYTDPNAPNEVSVMDLNKVVRKLTVPRRKVFHPIEIWCACPSYDLQKDTTQKKLLRYIPKHRIVDKTWVKKGVLGELILDSGDKINFKSYEQGREKFQGSGKRLIWFDEEPPRDIWEECFVRSEAGVPLDIILTMTPVNGMTWVYDEIYLAPTSDMFVSEAEWDNNPFLLESQKDQMMRGLRPEAIEVRRKGHFVKMVGLVCSWWDRTEHLKEFKFNKEWDCTRSALDFGFSNPACWGAFGADYDDNLYLYDGFYEKGLTTPKICHRIHNTLVQYGVNPNDHVVVADSAQAQSIQEANDYCAEHNLGITFIPVKKVPGTDNQNWDEYRAEKMAQYGEVKNKKTKVHISPNLKTFDERSGTYVNWFSKEATNLKWNEVATSSGEKQQGAMWDPRSPNHAIDMFTYYLVDHLGAPDQPEEKPLWHGKIPGTYIPPAETDEDEENDWGEEEEFDNSSY